MSGEFREVGRSFMWGALDEAGGDLGRHEISQALGGLYAALAELERDCAYYEASDSGASRPRLGLQRDWSKIEEAFGRLRSLHRIDAEFISDLLREREAAR